MTILCGVSVKPMLSTVVCYVYHCTVHIGCCCWVSSVTVLFRFVILLQLRMHWNEAMIQYISKFNMSSVCLIMHHLFENHSWVTVICWWYCWRQILQNIHHSRMYSRYISSLQLFVNACILYVLHQSLRECYAGVMKHNTLWLWWNVLISWLRSTVWSAWDVHVINRCEMHFNNHTRLEWDSWCWGQL